MSETGHEESNASLVLIKDLVKEKPLEGSTTISRQSDIKVPAGSFLFRPGHAVELPVGFFNSSDLYYQSMQGRDGPEYQISAVVDVKSMTDNDLYQRNPSVINNGKFTGSFGNAEDVQDLFFEAVREEFGQSTISQKLNTLEYLARTAETADEEKRKTIDSNIRSIRNGIDQYYDQARSIQQLLSDTPLSNSKSDIRRDLQVLIDDILKENENKKTGQKHQTQELNKLEEDIKRKTKTA